MSCKLYKHSPAWGLPSSSAASLQIEGYLRIAGLQYTEAVCSSSYTSPTGQLPALEVDGLLVETQGATESETARLLQANLRHNTDIDAALTAAQQAEVLAFSSAIESKLEPATVYTSWVEYESYASHTRALHGAMLPFPLNYIIPYTQRRKMLVRFSGQSAEQVYAEAGAAYEALAVRLGASGRDGPFFFGSRLSSLDALLYSHLVIHLGTPVSAPKLHSAASKSVLKTFAEHFGAKVFASPVPDMAGPSQRKWRRPLPAAGASQRPAAMTQKEEQQRRRSQLWLTGAAAAVAAYFLLSGQYIDFSIGYEYDEDDEPEEE